MPVAIVAASTLEQAVMGYRSKDQFLDAHAPTAIKIMESGIFFGGGLKGQSLGKNRYEQYPISNLEGFVYGLAMIFDLLEKQFSSSDQQSIIEAEFQTMNRSIGCLIPVVRRLHGKRNSNRLLRVQKEFADIRDNILHETGTALKRPNSNIKQLVAELFEKFVNTAPKTIIADSASELLTHFGINAGSSSIRKKLRKSRNRKTAH